MSNLTGHYEITYQAVAEISRNCSENTIASRLKEAGLSSNVVQRDIMDVVSLGHWGNYGQKHHFMRKFDGQSPRKAYDDSVEWIHTNALHASKVMSHRIKMYMHNPRIVSGNALRSCPLPQISTDRHKRWQKATAGLILRGDVQNHIAPPNWQPLGNALHALQDSFSLGHVIRSASRNIGNPGEIEHIKKYSGEEKQGHKGHDEKWWVEKTDSYSIDGRLAINASKALIYAIINNALHHLNRREVLMLVDWKGFKNHWLVASSKLSAQRDRAVDLIAKHHTGIGLGNSNFKTLNFNEEGLAKDLIKEYKTNTKLVYDVFKLLDEHFNSDADDVAVYYVKKLQKQKYHFLAMAVKQNKQLVGLLIKVMDEGPTFKDEDKCIAFLKK